MWGYSVLLVYVDERGLHADCEEWLEELAPHEPIRRYRHNRTGEDSGDAHLKRQVMGREVVVAITEGRLDFGPWSRSLTASSTAGAESRSVTYDLKPSRDDPTTVGTRGMGDAIIATMQKL